MWAKRDDILHDWWVCEQYRVIPTVWATCPPSLKISPNTPEKHR
jgi:hypothetical protein